MPMPPLLETIQWSTVYESGVDFDAWLTEGENEKHIEIMKKIRETQSLDDEILNRIASITKNVHVVAIAEDWCPDVVRHAPILQKICDQSDMLSMHFITRDAHKNAFIRFLTNGGEAIPKFIFLSDTFVECGNWGPMTRAFRDLISRGKACNDVAAAREIIHEAYLSDKERTDVVEELMDLIDIAGAKYPKEVGSRKIDPLKGKSLLPIFQGKERKGHETLYFHFGTDRALRQGSWKLVSAKLGRWELYNIDQDRTETNDLSKKHPERASAMAKEWFRLAKDVDRLKGRGLNPVKSSISKLNFRKDTSSGSVGSNKRKSDKKKKE